MKGTHNDCLMLDLLGAQLCLGPRHLPLQPHPLLVLRLQLLFEQKLLLRNRLRPLLNCSQTRVVTATW